MVSAWKLISQPLTAMSSPAMKRGSPNHCVEARCGACATAQPLMKPLTPLKTKPKATALNGKRLARSRMRKGYRMARWM